MKSIFKGSSRFLTIFSLLLILTAGAACAGQNHTMKKEGGMSSQKHTTGIANSIVGVQGYDLVSYRTNEKPLRGNGNHIVDHHGITYLFVNKENQEKICTRSSQISARIWRLLCLWSSSGQEVCG